MSTLDLAALHLLFIIWLCICKKGYILAINVEIVEVLVAMSDSVS